MQAFLIEFGDYGILPHDEDAKIRDIGQFSVRSEPPPKLSSRSGGSSARDTKIPPSHFEVRSEYIDKHPQIIIAPPDHEFAHLQRIPVSQLEGQTFLLREPGSGTRSVADNLFSKNKFSPSTGVEFGSNETIKQAVIAGMGIALISAHTVAAELEAKRLISLNVMGLPINRKWFVVKHKNKRLLPSSQALWDFFARSGKNYLPGESLS